VEGGVKALTSRVRDLVDESEIEAARDLLASLTTLAVDGGSGLDSLDGLRTTVRRTFNLSSTLRPTLQQMDRAVAKIQPSKAVFEKWRDDLVKALADLAPES